jgi:hypothetical protein
VLRWSARSATVQVDFAHFQVVFTYSRPMAGFVEGVDRGQSTLFPAVLDDYVAEDNPVRAVDVFVDATQQEDNATYMALSRGQHEFRKGKNCPTVPNSALDRDRDTVEACRLVLGMRCRPIDKSFVDALERTETIAVISSIVELAKSLNLAVIAEGIETDD